jgi:hypothetical protein
VTVKDFSYTPDKRQSLRDVLLSVWSGPRVDALLAAIAENQQEFEDTAYGIYLGLLIEAATGKFLDIWGKVYNEAREDMTDDEYRIVILTKAYALRASGNVADSKYVAEVLSGGTAVVYPFFPASYQVTLDVSAPLTDSARVRIRRILDYVRPAGVGAEYVEGLTGGFRFDVGSFDNEGLARIL